MTSEGQQAGQRPAEATSGGPAEPFGPDGFPPDADGSGRSSSPGFPTSYAPPPPATPNGGSPFVVPTVFGQPAQPSTPDSAERATPPQSSPPPTGAARVPGPPPAAPDHSAWAPQTQQSQPLSQPHSQPLGGPSGEIAGFAPGSPTRGHAGDEPPPPNGRPPGISAFGDQRVRVPGATLTGLPDAPAPGRGDSVQLPRPMDDPSGPPRQGRASDLPMRSPTSYSEPDSFSGFRPAGESARSLPPREAPDSSGGLRTPRASQAFGSSGMFRTPGLNTGDGAFGGSASVPAARPPEPDFDSRPDRPLFGRRAASLEDSPGLDNGNGNGNGSHRGSPFDEQPPGASAMPGRPSSGSPYDEPSFAIPPAEHPYNSNGGSSYGAPATGSPFDPAFEPPAFEPPAFEPPAFEQPAFEPPAFEQPAFEQPADASPFGPSSFGSRYDDEPSDQPLADGSPYGPPSPFGTGEAEPLSFGAGEAAPSSPAHEPGSDSDAIYGRPPTTDGRSSSGFVQRVPGASFNAAGPAPFAPAGPPPFSPAGPPASGPPQQPASRPPYNEAEQPQYQAERSPYGHAEQPLYGGRAEEPPYGQSDQPPYGQPEQPPYGRAGSSPYGPAEQSSYGQAEQSPFDQPEPSSPYGRAADQSPYGSSEQLPFAAAGPPPAEPYNGSVPQPRESGDHAEYGDRSGADRPATGTARPVSASASVPLTSRVAPAEDEAPPPPTAAPQARVYGRAAPPPVDTDDEPDDDASDQALYGGSDSDQALYGRSDSAQALYGRPAADAGDDSGSVWRNGQDSPWTTPAAPPAFPAYAPGGAPGGPTGGALNEPHSEPLGGAAPTSYPGSDNEPPPFPGPPNAPAWRGDDAPAWPGTPAPAGASPGRDPDERQNDDQNPSGARRPAGPPPPIAPQSPSGRVSGRATASARVAPPPGAGAPPQPGTPAGQSFSEPTTDVAGRGRQIPPPPPEQYTEHTTDISQRGPGAPGQPYVPSPALSPMHARPPLENGFPPPPDGPENSERPRMGGVFPGPGNRPSVTPPSGPDNTASWPQQAGASPADTGQSRFEQFKPEADGPAAAPATPPTPHVRLLPVIIGVIIGACLLVGLAIGVVWLISRGSDNGGFSVSAGDCVKRNGTEAVKSTCSDANAYQVVSVADTKDKCADPNQPYVLNPTKDGKTQVLCLKKNG